LRELAELALDVTRIKGAVYADIRIIAVKGESLIIKNGQVSHIHCSEDRGFGVRVIVDGAWGFASSDELTRNEIKRVAAQAVKIAKASALYKGRGVVLTPVVKAVTHWSTPFEIDPFTISLSEKIDLLLSIDKALRQVKEVKIARGNMEFQKKSQLFASTTGSFIEQESLSSAAGYAAIAINQDDLQIRSYPSSFGGQYMTRGYELIQELALEENASRIAEEAAALLKAPQCPTGYKDIILDSSQLALQIHESCGHPAELDRVLGTEADFAGRSFLTPDKLHSFLYGSPVINIVADSLTPGGMGTYGFDDEGVPAQRWYLVKEGFHVLESADGDADLADLGGCQRVVGIIADLRGQVEGDAQACLSLFEEIAVTPVGLFGGGEAGVLAHGPEPAAVHGGMDAAREGILARMT